MDPLSQQLLFTLGGSKTDYVDDVFSTYLFKGNATARSINNGVDLSGKGGMVWLKNRDSAFNHTLFDTVRGTTKIIRSSTNGAETSGGQTLTAFNNNGFTLGTDSMVNSNNHDTASWSFRKAKGFFDVLTYTGNGQANRVVTHNLASVPGCIMIKKTSGSAEDWRVYHRGTDQENPGDYYLRLNQNHARNDTPTFMDTIPTSTQFLLNSYSDVNANGETYVAYIFAGGESTAATAKSVDFDGSGDYLTQTCDAVLRNWWDQAFTVEYWVNADGFVSSGNGGPGVLGVCAPTSNGETWSFGPQSNGTVEFYYWNGSIQQITTTKALNLGQWYHLAMVYDGSSSIKIYINGILEKSENKAGSPTGSSTVFSIGKIANGSEFNGRVSNVRITHQALYTSSFKPSTEPFTTTSQGATGSNVKLLCCNNSSVTGSTVTPASITANGNPTASTDSPFDDPAGFKFGEEGDQNIIKCGACPPGYSDAKIELGFQPQFLLMKKVGSGNWEIWDSMRGGLKADSGGQGGLFANLSNAEGSYDGITVDATGFNKVSQVGEQWIYMAIRSATGTVTRPPSLGTDAFAMDTGAGSSIIPNFDSGFPVDFSLVKRTASSNNWTLGARLIQGKFLHTNLTDQEGSWSPMVYDSNVGWNNYSDYNSTYQSWMWKRHAGFDVVTYKGSVNDVPHNLGRVPEMIWAKNRDQSVNWNVYHKDLNGGSSPENWRLKLNDTDAESNTAYPWNDTAPTATHFTVGGWYNTNINGLFMLFASVDGISKVGNFTPDASGSFTVTTGFTPRFIVMRPRNVSDNNWSSWWVYDSLRGLTSGLTNRLQLSSNAAQISGSTNGVTATGINFTGFGDQSATNWIYYAHA